MARDDAYLEDILHSARAIGRYMAGKTFAEFSANEETQDAVCRRFEIIGEAARRLSAQTREAFPEIPWHLAIAMRNVLIHDYDDVKLEVVWEAVNTDLPPLIARLEKHLGEPPFNPA